MASDMTHVGPSMAATKNVVSPSPAANPQNSVESSSAPSGTTSTPTSRQRPLSGEPGPEIVWGKVQDPEATMDEITEIVSTNKPAARKDKGKAPASRKHSSGRVPGTNGQAKRHSARKGGSKQSKAGSSKAASDPQQDSTAIEMGVMNLAEFVREERAKHKGGPTKSMNDMSFIDFLNQPLPGEENPEPADPDDLKSDWQIIKECGWIHHGLWIFVFMTGAVIPIVSQVFLQIFDEGSGGVGSTFLNAIKQYGETGLRMVRRTEDDGNQVQSFEQEKAQYFETDTVIALLVMAGSFVFFAIVGYMMGVCLEAHAKATDCEQGNEEATEEEHEG